MDSLLPDIRYASRRLRKSPGITLAAIVTLALGIGANTAIFSLVDGVALRPLQITDPAHLVAVASIHSTVGPAADAETASSYAEYQDIRDRVPAFKGVVASSSRGVVLKTGDGLQMLLARVVSDNYFEVIGAHAELGRLPTEQELHSAQTQTMVLGHRAWQDFFGSDKSVIGRTVNVNGGLATVIGVMPAGFRGTDRLIDPQIFVPETTWLTWHPDERNASRTDRQFDVYARLAPSATLEQARSQFNAVNTNLAAQYPQANAGRSFAATWNSVDIRLKMLSALLLVLAGAVLLIACANIANLLLALNDGRRREMGMRVALGATRGRLLRQLVTEYALLATVGVAGALWIAQRLIAIVPGLIPNLGFPLGPDLRIDHRVLAFTVCIALLSIVICGVLPGLAATRTSPLDAMRPHAPSSGKLKMPARKIFVIAQVTASMALLIASGLLVRTLLHIQSTDAGFNRTQNAVLLQIEVDQQGPQRLATFATLLDRMKALPGVTGGSAAHIVPFAMNGGGSTRIVLSPGEVASPTAGTPIHFNQVDESYFHVMGVSLLQGRAFGRQDTPGGARVAIVNGTLARKLFGDQPAVGRHLRIGREKPVDAEIIGVAQDGKYNDLTEVSQPYLYLPLAQDGGSEITLLVTTAGDPNSLLPVARRAIRDAKPSTLIEMAVTLKDHMRMATLESRIETGLTASLGGLALLLTAVGLYGVIFYTVSRRTHEIGIRMALGAPRGRVLRQIFKEGMTPVIIGMTLGGTLAIFLGRAMSTSLYGVKPADPITLLSAFSLMIVISMLALIGPARRALRIEPMDALRED